MQKTDPFFYFLRSAILIAFLIAIPLWALFLKPSAGLDNHFFSSFKESVAPFWGQSKKEVVEPEPLRRETINEHAANVRDSQVTIPSSMEKPQTVGTNIEQISARSVNSNNVATVPYRNQIPPSMIEEYALQQPEMPKIPVSADFVQLENVLRGQLGAVSLSLEPWGTQGKLYRYSCYVSPSVSSPDVQKHFQAIASDPIQALQRVVQDVSNWQITNGNSQPRTW